MNNRPLSDRCQRWNDGHHTWADSSHRFTPSDYTVEPVAEALAKAFVTRNHYSHSYPAAIHRWGLWTRSGDLHGVAVFGIPASKSVLTNPLPDLEPYKESCELSRFILLDECGANAESWFLARAFAGIHDQGMRGVVSFADPVTRHAADGTLILPGHVGYIYQATNAVYTGRGTARTITVLPDGTTLNDRAAQKIRSGEQGHSYAASLLVKFGARAMNEGEDGGAWLTEALAAVGARKIRHGGAHRYVFTLGSSRRARQAIRVGMPAVTPYPKKVDDQQLTLV